MEEEMNSEPMDESLPQPETSTALVQTSYLDMNTPSKNSDDSLSSTPSRSEPGSGTSSERSTPCKARRESGGSVKLGDNFDTASTCSNTSLTSKGKLPARHGIQWKKGERVEAMDYMKKWYPAKIVEVDEEEGEVLIHFEGWNQRYDEWVPVTSDKLRPKIRHSERKEKKKKLHNEYKIGEHVYAKWTDCKMYPGKISNILSDGSFEIVFYDGFKKLVQPINVRPLPQGMQKQKVEIVHVLPKEARKRSLSNEDEKGSHRSRRQSLVPQETTSKVDKGAEREKTTDVKIVDGTTVLVKTETTSTSAEKTASPTDKPAESSNQKKEVTPSKFKKLIKKSEGTVKLKNSGEKDGKKSEKSGKVALSRDKTKRLPSKDKSHTGSSKSRTVLFPKKKKLIVAPSFFAKKEKPESVMRSVPAIKEENIDVDVIKQEPMDIDQIDTSSQAVESHATMTITTKFSPETEDVKPEPLPSSIINKGDNPLPPSTISHHEQLKKIKKRTVSPSASETSYSSESQSEDGIVARRRSHSTEKERGASYAIVTGPPPKAFVIEKDHNQYKCMFEGCNKSFRKENLLNYHIKYYHTEKKTDHLPQPVAKRRKTSSICSTDSDMSISSKQRSQSGGPVSGGNVASRKQRHVSADSALASTTITNDFENEIITASLATPENTETNIVEIAENIKQEVVPHQDTIATEESMETEPEPEDELSRDEVVNCICGYDEENGLMIQCDVCLCWQHAVCFEITTETLPSKYVCFVCENPPGVRDSCRYSYDQDWLKLGQPAQFSFLSNPEDEDKCLTIQATNGLIADVHNINNVLHSVRQKIKAVKNKDHPEYKLWKRNWDAEDTISLQDEAEDRMSVQEDSVPDVTQDDDQLSPETVAKETDQPISVTDENNESSDNKLTKLSDTNGENKIVNVSEDSISLNSASKTFDLSSIPKCESSASIATESTLTAVDETSQFSFDNEPSNMGEETQTEGGNVNSNVINFNDVTNQEKNTGENNVDKDIVPQEDPYKNCEKNLLEHIIRIQSEIDSRLDSIDEQLILLETAESTRGNNQSQDILGDVPALKKSLHILENDLVRVQRLSGYRR